MLSENAICCMIPFLQHVQNKQSIQTVSGLVFARGWGGGMSRMESINGCRISFWSDEKFLELDSGNGFTAL